MLDLASGRFDEAEKRIYEALALGERSIGVFSVPAFRLHLYALRTSQGRAAEVESTLRATVAEFPARPFIRCALVLLHAELGGTDQARRELNELARSQFAAIPFDIEWLYAMSLLAEACALLGDSDAATELTRCFSPTQASTPLTRPRG